jgi:hypothetical protein
VAIGRKKEKMKIDELDEMTMRGPELSNQAEQFANKHKDHWLSHGKHIADIENYRVLLDGIYYSLWDNDVLVACCSLSNSNNEVDDVYVAAKYRNKKIFSMILWFFKTRLNRSPLMLGSVHSKMMMEVVKGLSRFNKCWYNISTNEKRPFSVDTLDDYYSYLQPTSWRLMLENSGDFNWPMHNTGGYVKESYSSYIE